jgi:hypothetical protein
MKQEGQARMPLKTLLAPRTIDIITVVLERRVFLPFPIKISEASSEHTGVMAIIALMSVNSYIG